MTILDRYLLQLYGKVLIVSFVSLAGLYVVIDGFNNLDEFLSYGKRHSLGTAGVLLEYYGPRLLQFFDQVAGLLAMLASIFVLTVVSRANELTAILAAGVSPARVIQPLLVASLLVAGLGAANREVGLPKVRQALATNAQDWLGEKGRKCIPRYDIRTDILITGQATFANERRIAAPLFRLPTEFASWGRQVTAESALYRPATADHPAGFLLRKVSQPANLGELDNILLAGQTVLFAPGPTPWLEPNECFIASVVTFEQLAVGGAWRNYLSSSELFTGIRGQTIEPGADVRLTLHARFIQPLLDMSLVLLGIPLVLKRGSRNIFVAAAIGMALVGALFLMKMASHAMGNNYLLNAALAAWLPLLAFGPAAYVYARPLWD